MPLNWETLQTAVRTWVQNASGLGAGKYVWANQNGNKVSRPFITLRFGDLVPVGVTDEKRRVIASGTMTETVIGQRECVLTLQAFTDSTVGSSTARALLSRVQIALSLTSVRHALLVGGLTVFDHGAIQEISTVLDADFEGRALLPMRCYLTETVAETVPWIEFVNPVGYTGIPPDLGTTGAIDI